MLKKQRAQIAEGKNPGVRFAVRTKYFDDALMSAVAEIKDATPDAKIQVGSVRLLSECLEHEQVPMVQGHCTLMLVCPHSHLVLSRKVVVSLKAHQLAHLKSVLSRRTLPIANFSANKRLLICYT